MEPHVLRIMVIAVAASISFFLFVNEASARRRGLPLFFLINTGHKIYPVAPLPQDLAHVPELSGYQLGYKCSHFGLFGADIWCWDKGLVLFEGTSYMEIPGPIKQALEEQHPFSTAKRTLWNKYGSFVLLGIVVVLGFMKMRKRGKEILPEEIPA